MDFLPNKAISAAMRGDWKKAEELNRIILDTTPEDVEATNRLARALAEQGKIKEATKFAKRTLKLEPTNQIAKKCLERWSRVKSSNVLGISDSVVPEFLEEVGKTKVALAIRLASNTTLAQLNTGDELTLIPHNHSVSLKTAKGTYIGRLPDDLSSRLIRLLKLGFKYQVLVMSAEAETLKVFIREIEHGKNPNTISFPIEISTYMSDFATLQEE